MYHNLVTAVVLLVSAAHHCNIVFGVSIQVNHQSTQNEFLAAELPQEKIDQLRIPKDQTLVVRLPSNTLLKYTAYKDVSILHFRIPPDTRTAFFTFKAFEESKSAFQRKCKPRDVSLHLKASSYPVISPENITFPRNFLNADERLKIYDLQFQSDEMQQRITVDGPQVGNWFAVAFVSWTDPNNDRIEQQGLAASCDTLLLAEMSVSRFQPIIINNGQVHNGSLSSNSKELNSAALRAANKTSSAAAATTVSNSSTPSPATPTTPTPATTDASTVAPTDDNENAEGTSSPGEPSKSDDQSRRSRRSNSTAATHNEVVYKFYVPPHMGLATARITISRVCPHCPDLGLYIQANAYPSTTMSSSAESNYMHSTLVKPNQTGEVSIQFYVQPNAWHYAVLKFASNVLGDGLRRSSQATGTQAKPYTEVQPLAAYEYDSNSMLLQRRGPFRTRRQHSGIADVPPTADSIIWYDLEYGFSIEFHESHESSRDHKRRNSGLHNETKANTYDHTSYKQEARDAPDAGAQPSNGSVSNATDSSIPWQPVQFRDMEFYPLLRQTYREFFMFDYDLVPDANGTVPLMLNLTAGTPAGFAFEVGEVYDIGGTLSFAVSMKHGMKGTNELKSASAATPPATERGGILAEKLIGRPIDAKNEQSTSKSKGGDKEPARSNQTIIVCMHLGEPGKPTWPDKCRYGRKMLPASSIVNNTDSNTSTGLVHVPFPESGQWYVTMGLYCHGAETAARITIIDSVKEFVQKYASLLTDMRAPCACANTNNNGTANYYQSCVNERKCLANMNEMETLKLKECLMDSKCTPNYVEMTRKFEVHHKLATEQHLALDNCNTSVVFTISSSPCVAGRCGRFGRCYHYMSGGFVFSTCVCLKGYRGWDCTEDTQVPSSMSILLASLLLTLSNLLFFPSIYMALRRKYYTEAVIYFFAMFFSIFYHACDSGEDEYSFCLVKIGVLQFCDFYCGLLAIWVTLVAMSHIRQQFVSLLHMLGAILLAFGTELNKQSLWVFLAPALTGICIISVSWGLRCHKSRKWFPARKYLTVYMPLGTLLVMVGLVCYAFLQTKQNYHIVHSIWHMVMALSILCLLPSRKYFIPKC